MYYGAVTHSAKRRHISRKEAKQLVALKIEDILNLEKEQDGKCYLCKLSFEWVSSHYKATLDRIDSLQEYTLTNTRLACYMCNMLKGKFSISQLEHFARCCLSPDTMEQFPKWTETIETRRTMTDLYKAMRQRHIVEVTRADIQNMVELQQNKCSKTKLSFEWKSHSMFRPSIDRIDPNQGYTINNIQIVVWPYNAMKGVWSQSIADKHFLQLLGNWRVNYS